MNCPLCGADGADDQPVGPTVTVFCCSACVSTILRSFAGREDEDAHGSRRTPPAPQPTRTPAPA